MSDENPTTDVTEVQPADAIDPFEAVRAEARAEVQREYAARLALVEFKAQAAHDGVNVSHVLEYIDAPKLLGEDGWPSAENIREAVRVHGEPTGLDLPKLMGAGHYSGRGVGVPVPSLDGRRR
ncbi:MULTISPECIES: hypothetical protein [Streptomyces]|uniref:hypothetical protein n=1 Tax=Streptomyces TaxID=1883 RepID=UPI00163C7D92|nr:MULTISPECIES: hypothetical protein [Streptomyces]MBC2873971.1 hypothetical protein [Streptomyces sp. TYQ1024]UBI39088.1 hypothetical protein K7I03_23290 [Streptomyces mobaraensis]UKW31666.1 hypothetical protein MCU78_23235 [Streptomyces sp. TYQ1024]